MDNRNIYTGLLIYTFIFMVLGLSLSNFTSLISGIKNILFMNDILITDYIEIADIGGAFVNSSIVTLVAIVLLYINKVEGDGYTIAVVSLMSGFSLFGKNVFNIWFILLGTFIYSKIFKVPFSKNIRAGLLTTALSPIISFMFFKDGIRLWNIVISLFIGILIGIVVPFLSEYTKRIYLGYNLYNVGFACGLVALIIVPIMKSYGISVETVSYWSKENNLLISIVLYSFSVAFILISIFIGKNVFAGYTKLLKSTGQAPSDFIEMFGIAPTLLNMGINGIIATSYILIIGGDLNGPTLGGIITIIGFGAFGKHLRNIIPIILGVVIGGITKQWSLVDPSMQIAALFSTTLAPIAGAYGKWAGIISGFIHSSVVVYAGGGYSGMNLYNNGFAGGIVAMALYPVFSAFFRRKSVKIN